MMTVGDINNVTFEKTMRGYRPEDVDDFLAPVAQEYDALMAERDEALNERDSIAAAAQQEKEETEKKLYILAEKIEQYRADEENLKMTLLNAQRMGDTIVNEAKQKAESLIYEAKTRATQVHEEIKQQTVDEESKLAGLRKDVTKFRTSILEMYQRHIEAVSSIPTQEQHAKAVVSQPIFFAPEQESTTPSKVAAEEPVVKEQPIAAKAQEPSSAQEKMPEVEQPSFETASAVPAPIDSFENYQGISFDE